MAKDKTSGRKKGPKIPKQIAGVKIPKGLRDSGKAAVKFAQSPMARELLSAGMVAAAAAVAANSRARKTARQSGSEASDAFAQATNAAAESASQIGAAFVEAAGAAAQRLFGTGATAEQPQAAGGKSDVSVPEEEDSSASRVAEAPPTQPDPPATRATASAKRVRANGPTAKPPRAATSKARSKPAASE